MSKKLELVAEKNEKGFIKLYLTSEDLDYVPIEVCDFGGKDKVKARKLTYKLYCLANVK